MNLKDKMTKEEVFSAAKHWSEQTKREVEGAEKQAFYYVSIIMERELSDEYVAFNPIEETTIGVHYIARQDTKKAVHHLSNAAKRGDQDARAILKDNYNLNVTPQTQTKSKHVQPEPIITPSGEVFDEAEMQVLMQKAMAGDVQASKKLEEKYGASLTKNTATSSTINHQTSSSEKNSTKQTVVTTKKSNPIAALFRYLIFGIFVALLVIYFTSDNDLSPEIRDIKNSLSQSVNSLSEGFSKETSQKSARKSLPKIPKQNWNNVHMLPGEKFSFAKLTIRHSYPQLIAAARNDDIEAKVQVGLMYMYGEGINQDFDKAVYWFKESAKDNHPQGQKMLAFTYYGNQNKQAFKYFKKAALQGDLEAQHWISNLYYRGEGVRQSTSEADYWNKKAVEQEMKAMFSK
ncbi:MAG: tetratricopeptide repeat protein [Cognaticolwellia sp.]